GNEPGMAADLHALNEDAPTPPGLTIQRVRDVAEIAVWVTTLNANGFGEGAGESELLGAMYARRAGGDKHPLPWRGRRRDLLRLRSTRVAQAWHPRGADPGAVACGARARLSRWRPRRLRAWRASLPMPRLHHLLPDQPLEECAPTIGRAGI